jgi:uncharacterized damage-inducible protein DinB
MVEVFRYYAECNKAVNAEMMKILKNHGGEVFNYDSGAYYKSINDLLFHIFDVDLSWLYDIKNSVASSIYDDALFQNLKDGIPENTYKNPYIGAADFAKDRDRLDTLFVRLSHDITAEDLGKPFVYQGRDKQLHQRTVWQVLTHVYNHQTHHRGQISQILDVLNIDNDFSNMIRIDV